MKSIKVGNQDVITRSPSGNAIHWLLTSRDGAKNFEMRYIEIPVGGKTSYGSHAHEHEVFVVKGMGQFVGKDSEGNPINEVLEPMKAVFVPGYEEHQWVNKGDVVLGLICVIPIGAEDQYKPESWKK